MINLKKQKEKNPKVSLGSAPQKTSNFAICSSDHKTVKIFVKGPSFSKDAEQQL